MDNNDTTQFLDTNNWVRQPQSGQAEGVTLKVSSETVNAMKYMSRNSKTIEVIRKVAEMTTMLQSDHVRLMMDLSEAEGNLFFLEDFTPYTKDFSEDRVAQEFIPILMIQGFGGSKKFGRELQKIRSKQEKTQRKTYWMSSGSIRELERMHAIFEALLGMNKSQTFEFITKCYFRISGAKEEFFQRESYELAVVVENMMEDLFSFLEQINDKILSMKKAYPEHFDGVGVPKVQLDFNEEDVGWNAVLNNFEVLRNNFERHIRRHSSELPKAFLPDC